MTLPKSEQIPLRAGPLSLVYEAGDLRYIRLGDREILRRVYVAVRDQNWDTVPATLANEQLTIAADSFQISYDAQHAVGGIDFFWRGTISGNAQGTIVFAMDGAARSTFLRNRIGFCVLHPIHECAGQPCRVEQADGRSVAGTFPLYVAPHQPFRSMRSISHEVMPGTYAKVRFAGDVFEMEDQRNWTDASYKTYCTPLELPFPIEVRAGTTIAQAVTLTLHGAPLAVGTEPEPLRITRTGDRARRLPRLGLGLAGHDQPLSAVEAARLRGLQLAHLRTDLHLARPEYPEMLQQGTTAARVLGTELEIALFLSDAAKTELDRLALQLEQIQPPVCTWLVFHENEKATSARWVELARAYLHGYAPASKVGGGTNAYFAELNRARASVEAAELVSYSINPQVHAFDNGSLVEALAAQAATVVSARQFCGERPIAVSPITLKPRRLRHCANNLSHALRPSPSLKPSICLACRCHGHRVGRVGHCASAVPKWCCPSHCGTLSRPCLPC
ncbi:MAG: hypothetical protein H0X37_26405 [Herpetosiphonaceae bacterium]|nr:hypothetical protein [Herpetosiphonaceae bacterium]